MEGREDHPSLVVQQPLVWLALVEATEAVAFESKEEVDLSDFFDRVLSFANERLAVTPFALSKEDLTPDMAERLLGAVNLHDPAPPQLSDLGALHQRLVVEQREIEQLGKLMHHDGPLH